MLIGHSLITAQPRLRSPEKSFEKKFAPPSNEGAEKYDLGDLGFFFGGGSKIRINAEKGLMIRILCVKPEVCAGTW